LRGFADVQRHSNAQPTDRGKVFRGQRALRFDRRRNRVGRAAEGHAEFVADRLKDVSAMHRKDATKQFVMPLQRKFHCGRMTFPPLRRAFDVRK
jgi:hypothetical protein